MSLKQITTTLQHQTEILQSILDSIGEGVVVADENGKFLLFNPAAEKLTGIGATESQQEEIKTWISQKSNATDFKRLFQ